MKQKFLTCLMCCCLALIALLAPQPAAADTYTYSTVEITQTPVLTQLVAPPLVVYSQAINHLNHRSDVLYDAYRSTLQSSQSRPTDQLMVGYARTRTHTRHIGRHTRQRSTSRCSGGICRA